MSAHTIRNYEALPTSLPPLKKTITVLLTECASPKTATLRNEPCIASYPQEKFSSQSAMNLNTLAPKEKSPPEDKT